MHPKLGKYSIRFTAQGDKSGTASFVFRPSDRGQTISIVGGTFQPSGATSIDVGASQVLEVTFKATANEGYIYFQEGIPYVFQESQFASRTVNSPLIDYTSNFKNLASLTNMFRDNPIINSSIGGVTAPIIGGSPANSMENMFAGASKFNRSVNHIDTKDMVNFSGVFANALLFNQSLSNWDTSKATQMEVMFSSALSFNQPLNNFNVSNVTAMYGMFQNAKAFNQDLSSWNFNKEVNLTNFVFNSGLSPTNYDKLLVKLASIDWTGRATPKVLGADGLRYTSTGEVGRNTLVNAGWTINDNGKI